MKHIKKYICLFLSISMLLSCLSVVFASDITTSRAINIVNRAEYADDIIDFYNEKIADIKLNNHLSSLEKKEQISTLFLQRNATLTNAGYILYDVNPSTYAAVQNELKTDLSALGLNPNSKYTIIIDGANGTNLSRSTPSGSFIYTYNGVNYTLRYLTVTAADDPMMQEQLANDSVVFSSSNATLINNFLNGAVSTYLSFAHWTFGFFYSLLGIDLVSPKSEFVVRLNGGVNWTRRYVQVYNDYYQSWTAGSFVESVYCAMRFSGSYYNSSTNKTVTFAEQTEHTSTLYSSKYSDNSWQQLKAVQGYINSYLYRDTTGDVSFMVGTTELASFDENF